MVFYKWYSYTFSKFGDCSANILLTYLVHWTRRDQTPSVGLYSLLSTRPGLGASAKSLLNLAERMVRGFNANICSNQENAWRPLPIAGAQDILIKTSLNIDQPGIPCGVSVTIATSLHLHVQQNDVFDFLRCEQNRNKWDILSYGLAIRDIIRISSARNSTDCVSVVLVEPTENRRAVAYLHESFCDSTAGYYVVYAPIDISAMDHIMEGKNSENVSILGSGFAVLPGKSDRESILTIGFQIMDEELTRPEYLPPQSVLTAHRLMKETISLIKTADKHSGQEKKRIPRIKYHQRHPKPSGKSPDRCRGDNGPIHKVGEDGRKETEACIEFVNRVAKTLDDDYKYKSFLDAVNGLGEGKDIDRVRNEVYLIFKDHPELEIEFSWFLADFYEVSGDEVDTNFNFFSRNRRAEGGEVRQKKPIRKNPFRL
ncbi:homeobox-leucine zipper protein PROTODERMAL FACTOR 2-like [Forsythia ovata]|uniref:Homeobox-leucine zipper protein PROTODERMAL FACTOR 2-like n=1 Tax=Forsythia ovata TaxID=205694 RepID=A0ABD1S6E0_9LAMI